MANLDESFLAAVAHELRTPLAVVLGYAELLGRGKDEETRTEASTMLLRAGARLSETLDELLLLLAVEGDSAAELTSFDLRRAVAASDRGAGRILTAGPGPWPLVLADPERVERAAGAIAGHLLSLAGPDHAVVVSCAETGRGAALTFALRPAGESSAEAADQGARRGSLLRLRLARRLVEASGGTLRAEPEGSGAWRFVASLPLAPR